MPVDYWNQFINTDDENVRSPPFNPATHHRDGTPITPECRPGEIHQTADTHLQGGCVLRQTKVLSRIFSLGEKSRVGEGHELSGGGGGHVTSGNALK